MAIAAHWELAAESPDRPREPRRNLRLEAEGALESGAAPRVVIHNLSTTGLLIESTTPLAIEEKISIDLPEAGSTPAQVVWSSGDFYGCQFQTPISGAALSAVELRSAVRPPLDIGALPGLSGPSDRAGDEAFGIRLQRLRKQQGLTLAQIADELGVSKPTVWAWEKGRTRPVESRLEALAQALGVDNLELRTGHDASGVRELLRRSRNEIAQAVGTAPENVRIMIEL